MQFDELCLIVKLWTEKRNLVVCVLVTFFLADMLQNIPNVAKGKVIGFAKFAFGQIRLNSGPPNLTEFNLSEFGFKFGKQNNSVKFVIGQ